MRFLSMMAAGAGALFAASAANAAPITASVTSPFACSAGTCTYQAQGSAVLTDFQLDFAIPQFGSVALPVGAVITGMSVNVSGSYTTSGTVTAGPTGASSVVVTTDNITTTMTAGTTAVGNFTGLGGNSPSSLNFQVSNAIDRISNQSLGNLAANASGAVSFTKTLPNLVNFSGVDAALIGVGTYLVEFGTSTFTSVGFSSGNLSDTQLTTKEDLTLNLTYTYAIDCRLTPEGCGVPEPASMSLLGMGLVGLGAFARRRRAAK